jgi:hypothetical protein
MQALRPLLVRKHDNPESGQVGIEQSPDRCHARPKDGVLSWATRCSRQLRAAGGRPRRS